MRSSPNNRANGRGRAAVRRFAVSLVLGALSASAANPGPPAPAAEQRTTTLSLPFSFEANRGQVAGRFQFIARSRGCTFLLAPDEAVVALAKTGAANVGRRADRFANPASIGETSLRLVRMRLAGADPRRQGAGTEPLPGRVNYLLGNDPAQWQTGVPTFAKLCFREVYPGVDLVYYGRDRQLEYDFIVAPGADPACIAFDISGADRVSVDPDGDLVLNVGGEQLRQHRPIAYQSVGGRRVPVDSHYRLAGPNRVEFRLGAYDPQQALVIDPVFSYATYFGGTGKDVAWDVAVDASGAVFIAGETTSAELLTTAGAFQTNYGGTTIMEDQIVGGDAFVAKLGPAGTNLVYLTYLGGVAYDGALALAIDLAGNAYLTGFTCSTNFPTVGPLKPHISGIGDPVYGIPPLEGFVAKLNPDGASLAYSAYLGGADSDEGIGIAVDPATGQAFVAGFTESRTLPTIHALQPALGGLKDGFVAKLNAAGSAFEYLTYLGGVSVDYCNGIATDGAGYAYVTGQTRSTNFWSTNAVQPQINNPSRILTNYSLFADAFVTKLTPSGALVYSTFLGGEDTDFGFRVAADAVGNAYVVGAAQSRNFPVTHDVDGGVLTNRGMADVFVTKVAPEGGTNWLYSVLFGGSLQDEGWDLAVDASGQVAVIGTTSSPNFPTREVPPGGMFTNNGLSDVFVAGLTADGSALAYSFYYGGLLGDLGAAIRRDPAGNLLLAGSTSSTNLFVQNALQPGFGGGTEDAFVARLVMPPVLSIVANGGAPQVQWRAPAPEFVLESKHGDVEAGWTPVAGPPTTVNGHHTVNVGGATNSTATFRLRLP